MARVQCLNREINAQMCPCTETSCQNWAICCLCVANHRGNALWPHTACQGGKQRPQTTLELPERVPCPNLETNLADCLCTSEPCVRRGVCCACIDNHWSADGKGRVACFRI
ncbi:MAG: hypothetical protein AB7W28_06170 [Armatimonadota bacterium]